MDEQLNSHIGQRLRMCRRARSLSQSDLGAMTQIRFRQIHKYEAGSNRMSASVLWKFACALNVPVHYFFEGLSEVRPTLQDVEPAASERPRLSVYARQRDEAGGKRFQQSAR